MKKILLTVSIIVFIFSANLKAQSIFICLNNGNVNQFTLYQVQKISFSETDMIVHKTDGTEISFPVSDILKCYYGTSTDVEDLKIKPSQLEVFIRPNPSFGSFYIEYETQETSNVIISIISTNGQIIDKLYSGKKEKGKHSLQWNNNKLKAGTYFIKIKSNNKITTKKLIILK